MSRKPGTRLPPFMLRLPIYATVLIGIFGYQWWRGQQPKEILVEVGAGGALRLEGHPQAVDTLGPALRQARERSPKLPVVVRADPALPAGAVLPVVEQARAAGITDLQFDVAKH
ncbi:MAG TPA: biopolymer transporter ExbD [Solimonas sp.]|nr:biopolymer transporter ExbD [Solimonas sp.]